MSGRELDERYSELLDARLDAGDPELAAELRRSLAEDPDQQKDYEGLAEVVSALRRLPAEEAPADFLRGVQSRIRRRTRGRYFHKRVRYRFPYEAVFNAILLGILFAVYFMALPVPTHVPSDVRGIAVQNAAAPATIGAAVLAQYGPVEVAATEDDGNVVVYRTVVPDERVPALLRELSLYPELWRDGPPEPAERAGHSVIRVRAPNLL